MSRTTHGFDHDFTVGERGFDYYSMEWGEVISEPEPEGGFKGWFKVRHDNGNVLILNDERFILPGVAKRFGYGTDPKETA